MAVGVLGTLAQVWCGALVAIFGRALGQIPVATAADVVGALLLLRHALGAPRPCCVRPV